MIAVMSLCAICLFVILIGAAQPSDKDSKAVPQNGKEDKEKGLFRRLSQPGLVEDLREHLVYNGYPARVIDKKGPEAIHHTVPLAGSDPLALPRMAVVKVEDHNLEYVEVVRWLLGSARTRGPVPQVAYLYVYVMRAEVGPWAAEIGASTVYPPSSEPSAGLGAPTWRGGWLARILSADGELASMLEKAGSPSLVIRANARDDYVAIIKELSPSVTTYGPVLKYGEWDFASPEELAVYDHIFLMIKESMRDWKSGMTSESLGSDGRPLASRKVVRMSGQDWLVTGVLLLLLFAFSSAFLSLFVGIPLTIIAAAGLLYYQLR